MPNLYQAGVSLVEVLVSTAVVGVLVGLGLPAFGNLTHDNHRESQLERYGRTLLIAREAALSEARGTGLCRSEDGRRCTATPSPDWQGGWLLYGDSNGNRQQDPDEPVLLHTGPHGDGSGLRVRSSAAQLYYLPDGSLPAPFDFLFCDRRGLDESRSLVISRVGRPRIDSHPSACQ